MLTYEQIAHLSKDKVSFRFITFWIEGLKMEMEKLVGSADAKLWAKAFMEFVELLPNLVKDEEMLTGWFANVIMSGYDLGHKAGQQWAWIPVDEKQPKDLECTLVVLHGKKAFLYYGGKTRLGITG